MIYMIFIVLAKLHMVSANQAFLLSGLSKQKAFHCKQHTHYKQLFS